MRFILTKIWFLSVQTLF